MEQESRRRGYADGKWAVGDRRLLDFWNGGEFAGNLSEVRVWFI